MGEIDYMVYVDEKNVNFNLGVVLCENNLRKISCRFTYEKILRI